MLTLDTGSRMALPRVLAVIFVLCSSRESCAESRVTRDLLALYRFEAGSGDIVRDESGVGEPLDLRIDRPERARRTDGRLAITRPLRIVSRAPARKIIEAVKRSGELTVEAWVKPANEDQDGPARIVSISQGISQRNVTLGQDGDRYEVRLRTTSTSKNGMPSTVTRRKTLRAVWTHVVYTRDKAGNARLYLDGKQAGARRVAGKLTSWNDGLGSGS